MEAQYNENFENTIDWNLLSLKEEKKQKHWKICFQHSRQQLFLANQWQGNHLSLLLSQKQPNRKKYKK